MKILIIRFSSFGDIILTTPIITELRQKYKDAQIDFLVYENFAQSIKSNKKLNNVFLFDKKKKKKEYIEEWINKLNYEKYDYIIDLHSKFLSIYVGKQLSKLSQKTKYLRYKKRKCWKTILVKLRLIKYNADKSIVESYFTALKTINVNYNGENLEYYINYDIKNKINVNYKINEKKYIVLAPGASKYTKEWPYYEKLANLITEKTNYEVIVIGGKEDFDKIKETNKIQNLSGKISFEESAYILQNAKIVVANDSGPFHLSRAVKSKTIGIFGPTDPKLFKFNDISYLVTSNQKCEPCSLYGDKKCPKKHFKCMNEITVNQIFDLICKKIDI